MKKILYIGYSAEPASKLLFDSIVMLNKELNGEKYDFTYRLKPAEIEEVRSHDLTILGNPNYIEMRNFMQLFDMKLPNPVIVTKGEIDINEKDNIIPNSYVVDLKFLNAKIEKILG